MSYQLDRFETSLACAEQYAKAALTNAEAVVEIAKQTERLLIGASTRELRLQGSAIMDDYTRNRNDYQEQISSAEATLEEFNKDYLEEEHSKMQSRIRATKALGSSQLKLAQLIIGTVHNTLEDLGVLFATGSN